MAASWHLSHRPAFLANLAAIGFALAIALHFVPVPSPKQVAQDVAGGLVKAAATVAQPRSIPKVFPIEGLAYSPDLVTDRPGSPRSGGRVHAGVDLATGAVFRVVAIMDGLVDELKPDSGVGGVIGISGKDSEGHLITYRYVHLDREPLRRFRMGQQVKVGTYLSTVSTTFPGSSKFHLHTERYVNGYTLDWNIEKALTYLGKS